MESISPLTKFGMTILTKRPEGMGFPEYRDYQKQLKKGLKDYKHGEVFFTSLEEKKMFTSDGDVTFKRVSHTYKK